MILTNKYGVPYHDYSIKLIDGEEFKVDVGVEEDWGEIQSFYMNDGCGNMKEFVGWGNDSDGHREIIDVIDCETNRKLNPMKWAYNRVWCYVDNYSS